MILWTVMNTYWWLNKILLPCIFICFNPSPLYFSWSFLFNCLSSGERGRVVKKWCQVKRRETGGRMTRGKSVSVPIRGPLPPSAFQQPRPSFTTFLWGLLINQPSISIMPPKLLFVALRGRNNQYVLWGQRAH